MKKKKPKGYWAADYDIRKAEKELSQLVKTAKPLKGTFPIALGVSVNASSPSH